MAGETHSGASSLTTSIPTKINSDLLAEVRENSVMLPFVDFRPLAQNGGLSMSFPKLATTVSLTAITSGSAEADAQSATTLETTVATATAASKSAHVLQSWISSFGSAVNWAAEVPAILGRAAADLMDSDAAALLAGFSSTAGSSGVDASIADFRAASIALRVAMKGQAKDAVAVLHPVQVNDLDAELQSGAGASLSPLVGSEKYVDLYSNGVMDNYRGKLNGIPIFASTNVSESGGNKRGAMFVPKRAIAGCYAWLPQIKMADQSVNLKLADSYQVSCCYGFIEKEDAAGVSIITDA